MFLTKTLYRTLLCIISPTMGTIVILVSNVKETTHPLCHTLDVPIHSVQIGPEFYAAVIFFFFYLHEFLSVCFFPNI